MLTLLSAFSLFVPFRVSLIYPPCMTHLAFRTPRWTTVNETTITAFGPINGPFKVVYCCVVIVYICLDTNSSTPQTLHITRFCHVFSPHPNLAPTYSYFWFYYALLHYPICGRSRLACRSTFHKH